MLADQLRGRTVGLRYRDPQTNQRIIDKAKETIPYCFITVEDSQRIEKQWINSEPGFKGLYKEELVKITFGDPYDMKQFIKSNYIRTWEGNIPFPNRVLADRSKPIPRYSWRKAYLDGEWKTESGEITILALYDSYTGKMFQWVQHSEIEVGTHARIECKNHPEGKTHIDYNPHLIAFSNEHDLLKRS